MGKEIKDAISGLRTAEQAVNECRERISLLKNKAAELQQSIPAKSAEVESAKRAKEKALDGFVTEQITEAELESARKRFDAAEKSLVEIEELITATHRAISQQKENLPRLLITVESAKNHAWLAISDDLVKKARAAAGDLFAKACVAKGQCGVGRLDEFIMRAIDLPPTGEFNRIRDEIEKEYFKGSM